MKITNFSMKNIVFFRNLDQKNRLFPKFGSKKSTFSEILIKKDRFFWIFFMEIFKKVDFFHGNFQKSGFFSWKFPKKWIFLIKISKKVDFFMIDLRD